MFIIQILYVFHPGGEKEKTWARTVRKCRQCTSGTVHPAETCGGKTTERLFDYQEVSWVLLLKEQVLQQVVPEEKKRKRDKFESESEADEFHPGVKVEVEQQADRPVRACRTQQGTTR